MNCLKVFIVLIAAQFFLGNLWAQDLLFENTVPVGAHKIKVSSVAFDKGRGNSAYILFTPKDSALSDEDRAALIYSVPDNCTKNIIVMDEVFHHTEGSEALDLTIYNSDEDGQVDQAKKVRTAKVSWDPTYDISAGYDNVDAKMQDLARAMNPICLPARYRFVYVGSQRYREVRYGDKAWDNN